MSELEEYRLVLKRLSNSIVPDACCVRVRRNRVTLMLIKEVEMKWFSLVKAGKWKRKGLKGDN